MHINITVDEEHSYVPSVDDLIIDTLQDIEVQFDHIPESPMAMPLPYFLLGTPDLFFEQGEIYGTQRND